jgi:hypothetical protein
MQRDFNKLLCRRQNTPEIMKDKRWIKVQDIKDLNKKPVKVPKSKPVVSERKLSAKKTFY